MTKFRDLNIGDTFDFVSPRVGFNSYFSRCRKTSTRCYVAIEGEDEPRTMRVGSINAEVFHVETK